MRFGSLFSGIEAASAAWLPLGWSCAWVAEIDPFACAVLAHHYPDVPNLGDVNRIDPDAVEPVDLIVFGSPCQSFSVAGRRLGLDDPRGNMALVGLRVIGRIRPRWVVWENVPGVLSSDNGRDFGAFLGLLGELGYGFAYRVLDARHAGVPQRRRRVFVVGCLGDWRGAAAVLFEPESLRGDTPPRREAGERVAASLSVGSGGSCGHQYRQKGNEDAIVAFGGPSGIAHSLRADSFDAGEDGTGRGTPLVAVPLDMRQISRGENEPRPNGSGGGAGVGNADDPAYTVTDAPHAVMTLAIRGRGDSHDLESGMSVRRLTPVECLRLMGFPDDYLDIQYRGKPAADGNKYRATGNSMCVPVVAWLGRRIQQFTDTITELSDAAE